MKTVCILGCTGSVGLQALEVVGSSGHLRVISLAAGSRWEQALALAKESGARVLALADEQAASKAENSKAALGLDHLEILSGPQGVEKAALLGDVDVVLHAIPGFEGIGPLISCLERGKRVAFAGKESLVCAGDLIKDRLTRENFVPVDSEHSAIFQCLLGENPDDVSEIVLTASGGALRDLSKERMERVTPEDVLNHPTWRMGKKITVDSATLFNKGLEVIEAHYLFQMPYENIRVTLHRQSIVHSMVTFKDGTTIAQAARPDMRLAIAYGLTFPRRVPKVVESLTPYCGTLTFEKVDGDRFPCLSLCYEAGKMGGTAPCALSCADEVLVKLFLNGKIAFGDIGRVLKRVLDTYDPKDADSLETLQEERDRAVARVGDILWGKTR